MSNTKHTPEPWSWWRSCCREGGMITQDARASHVAAPTFYPNNAELTQANADRIVACVNGCKDLNPAAYAECVEVLEYVRRKIDESEEWWMDSPDRGGFDADRIDAATTNARGEA